MSFHEDDDNDDAFGTRNTDKDDGNRRQVRLMMTSE